MKRAQECGLSEAQAQAFLNKHVGQQQEKQAVTLDTVVTNILKSAGVPKNDQSVAYAQGVLKAGVDAGLPIDKAAQAATKMISSQVQQQEKQASEQDANVKLRKYAEGFMTAAIDRGFTPGQSYALLNQALSKQAGPMDAGGQPGPGPMPASPGAPPAGGGQDQIMALLAQLLGGQGGMPGGMPGAAPGGAGTPPMFDQVGAGGPPGMA